ncbi:type II toxin-antitoxin system RelE/ParE family toxin [Salmonella enterica]|nr:type II toxin-antitoxin system RelE/ParE family toxin [Salmonella enterica]ECW0266612.1 type II toxin-antitoxin system RelE/ParE family toxin [Salmonella enterica subsp. diarizonae]EBD5982597.1 type II toxin-antitoxin system RelE/ParE family toxin [Salmonella enterica]EBI4322945.1 type II toxin-antitoxin system RelE/ParE family toxin [Salmonella enterica]ECO4388369.1 type II toxin-antitoxin system RelE/ParE family toxin [Salmonella enterica]
MQVEYTLTAKTSLEQIADHLRSNDIDPRPVIAEILEQFENRVTAFPSGCQLCPELLKLGVSKYRECNTPEGYRVLYSVEGEIITAHVILSWRQDIKQLLFRRMIQV